MDEFAAFMAGYQACMKDLGGPMTMERVGLMWGDPQMAAASAYDDPDWLDEFTDEWLRRPPAEPPTIKRAVREGIVYVFKDDASDRYKIGWTSHPPLKRLAAIEKAAGCHLSIVGTIPGTMEDEKHVHRRFKADCIRGEWFRGSDALKLWAYGLPR